MIRWMLCVALLGCARGPARIHYAGPPVGACSAGRDYQPPSIDAPAQPFVPVAEATPNTTEAPAKGAVKDTPTAAEPVEQEADTPEPKTTKAKTKKKEKKAKRGKGEP